MKLPQRQCLAAFLLAVVSGCGPHQDGTSQAPLSKPAGAGGLGENRPATGSSVAPVANSFSMILQQTADLRELARTNPDAAFAKVREMPTSSTRDGAFCDVLAVVAENDPSRARLIFNNWESLAYSLWTVAAVRVATELAKLDPAKAREFIGSDLPSGRRAYVWSQLLVSMEPALAASFYGSIPEGTRRMDRVGELMKRWTLQDPGAAAAWLDSIVAGLDPSEIKEFEGFGNAIIGEPKDRQPKPPEVLAGAKSSYEAARHPMARQLLAKLYLREVERSAPDQLVEITAAAEAETGGVTDGVARRQMYADPAGYAAALSPEEIKALPVQAIRDLADAWSIMDVAAAADWFRDQGRMEVAGMVAGRWFTLDPEKAVAFALALPQGPGRDDALRSLCHFAASEGKNQMSESCYEAIQDPQTKKSAGEELKRMREKRP
jgi:hypothetical protein